MPLAGRAASFGHSHPARAPQARCGGAHALIHACACAWPVAVSVVVFIDFTCLTVHFCARSRPEKAILQRRHNELLHRYPFGLARFPCCLVKRNGQFQFQLSAARGGCRCRFLHGRFHGCTRYVVHFGMCVVGKIAVHAPCRYACAAAESIAGFAPSMPAASAESTFLRIVSEPVK